MFYLSFTHHPNFLGIRVVYCLMITFKKSRQFTTIRSSFLYQKQLRGEMLMQEAERSWRVL